MEVILPIIAFTTLGLKVVDFLRYAKNADVNGVVTQLIAWVAGVGVVMIAAHTQWATGIAPVGNASLATYGIWDQVFAGLALGSSASFLKDTLKSVDNSNSSAIPTLLDAGPRNRQRTRNTPANTDAG